MSKLRMTRYEQKAVFVDKDENGFRGTTLIQHPLPRPFSQPSRRFADTGRERVGVRVLHSFRANGRTRIDLGRANTRVHPQRSINRLPSDVRRFCLMKARSR